MKDLTLQFTEDASNKMSHCTQRRDTQHYMNMNISIYTAVKLYNEITNRLNRKKKTENIQLAGSYSRFYM